MSELRNLLWVLAGLLVTVALSVLANRRSHSPSLVHKLGRLLWAVTGGLILYNYYALGMPGSGVFSALGTTAGLILIVGGGIIGMLLYRPARSA